MKMRTSIQFQSSHEHLKENFVDILKFLVSVMLNQTYLVQNFLIGNSHIFALIFLTFHFYNDNLYIQLYFRYWTSLSPVNPLKHSKTITKHLYWYLNSTVSGTTKYPQLFLYLHYNEIFLLLEMKPSIRGFFWQLPWVTFDIFGAKTRCIFL